MQANPGPRTHINLAENYLYMGDLPRGSSARNYNGLVWFGQARYNDCYPSGFGGYYRDSRILHSGQTQDFVYANMLYGAGSVFQVGNCKTKVRLYTNETRGFVEQKSRFYNSASEPELLVYVRMYQGMPYINVTWVMSFTDVVGAQPISYAVPVNQTGMGYWDGIYVPTLGWHNYTGGNVWKTVIDDFNKTSWTDNYVIPHYPEPATSVKPAYGIGFVNRTQISSIEAYHDDSVGKITRIRWSTFKEYKTIKHTYFQISASNVVHTSLSNLTSAISAFARMALTERTLTYSEVSVGADTIDYRVTASYIDSSTSGWSITPDKNLPTYPMISGAGQWTPWGVVTYVSNNSIFTLPKPKHTTYETSEYLKWAKNIVSDAIGSNFWVNQSNPFVAGWKRMPEDATVWSSYCDMFIWGWQKYYNVSADTTALPYIKSYLNMLVSRQKASGLIPLKIIVSTGEESGESIFSFLSLSIGYLLFSNSSYLRAAEKHVNWIQTNNKWGGGGRYYVPELMHGLILLHGITGNATYYSWIKSLTTTVFEGVSGSMVIGGIFDESAGLFGIDVAQNSDSLIALILALDKYGESIEPSRNITNSIRIGIEWNMKNRDSYSGQILSPFSRYPLYCIHQCGVIASLMYLQYLIKNDILNRTYLMHALENFAWIEGWNEKNFDFFANEEGKVYRAIILSGGVPTLVIAQFLYDKGGMLQVLALLSQVQNDVFLYDQGFRTTSVPKVIASTAMISDASYTSNLLKLTLNSLSGTTSTTKVYCGDKGEPKSVWANDTLFWSYNASTMTLSLDVTHVSPIEIVVDWRIPGDVNGDGAVDIDDLEKVAIAYGSTPGEPTWNVDTDLNRDNIVNILELFTVGKNYEKREP